ncbi:MAG: glycoside-pentoside-hexuronide (GPH):cation symporter [Bacillota bacterium]|nr:glycoside-pentoside-hexuronide (GPH):cation symporter [Bacillota bacterium]
MEKINNDKLTFRAKLGYSSASIGDAVAYMLVTTFIMFFLTTVAGLQPAVAGTLTAIGTVWDAVFNPIIGYLSDHARTRWGRRRPFMIGACLPLIATMVLLFSSFNVSYGVKVLYYGIMIVAFWTGFTGFFVPYYALGAEYTKDYEERTTLRAYASFLNMIGTLFSMVLPTLMVEVFENHGLSTPRAWQFTAFILGAISVISIIITGFAAKEIDVCEPEDGDDEEEKVNVIGMFREYLQVLSLGPMRILLCVSLFYLLAYAILMSDFVYVLTYNLGFDGTGVSMGMLLRSVIIIAFIPPILKLCEKTDKRLAMMYIIAGGIVGLLILRFLPFGSMPVTVLFILVTAITTQTYWQIIPAIFYDVCEYDEYKTGNRREGAILAVQGLVEAIASGLGTQILGIILQFAGFNGSATVQSQETLDWILNCTTWIPVIFLIAAGVAVYKFPITKQVYEDIVRELSERKKTNGTD